MNRKLRLALTAMLFLAWLGWLGYAALNKNRGPVVSHAQAAATKFVVIAEVKARDDGKPSPIVSVVEPLSPGAPAAGSEQYITNLPQSTGFTETGRYLLLLIPDADLTMLRTDGPQTMPFVVVGQQRSPAYDLAGVGPPMIYPDSPEVRKQAEALLK